MLQCLIDGRCDPKHLFSFHSINKSFQNFSCVFFNKTPPIKFPLPWVWIMFQIYWKKIPEGSQTFSMKTVHNTTLFKCYFNLKDDM